MPDEREALGLLALMLLTDARRGARLDARGRLVLLEDQDRSLWDREQVDRGHRLVLDALRGGRPGRFALQAAIAALHDQAPSWAETDWPQILSSTTCWCGVWPSPVVALNRAVAVAMVHGPEAGLAEVAALEADGRLAGYRYLPATKADLLRRLGRRDEAGGLSGRRSHWSATRPNASSSAPAGTTPAGPEPARRSAPGGRLLQRSDVDLRHLQHRGHDALALRVGVGIILVRAAGKICHDRPNLSLSQPHWPTTPPPSSGGPVRSISSWSCTTESETASVNVKGGPPLSAMNGRPVEREIDGHTVPSAARGPPRPSG